jgi:tetratricopeptide (TPR) repeat protein
MFNKWLMGFLLICANLAQSQSLSQFQERYKAEKYTGLGHDIDSIFQCCAQQVAGKEDDWHFLAANAYMKTKGFEKAKAHYESIGFKPEEYALNYGICLLRNQQIEAAFPYLNDYYNNHQDDYKAIYWLGECFYYQQKPKDALRILQRAVDSFSDDPDAYYLMGIIHTERNEFEKAFIYFQAAYDIRPTLLPAKFNMGMAKYYAQQMESAEEIFSELALEKPDNLSEVLMLLGEIRYRFHDEEGACEYWKESTNYGSEEAKASYQKVCIDKKGNPKFIKKSFISF